MHRIRVVQPRYEQSKRFAGMVGVVIGHWSPENSEEQRQGYLVEVPGGEIVGVAEDEAEDVSADEEV